ncbi:hypothetical protein [Methylobacterium sp. CM6247]
MLSGPDLSGFDLAALAAGLEASALRQDRSRRLASSIGVPSDCPETTKAVAAIDADAAATAEACRLVSLLRRFAADEGHARPSAVVTQLRVVPRQARRPSLLARAFAVLTRPNSQPEAQERSPARARS